MICPTCKSTQSLAECMQGDLGNIAQLRCRYCGAWWAIPVNELPVLGSEAAGHDGYGPTININAMFGDDI